MTTTTETPRTDAIEFRHCPPQPEAMLKKHEDAYALSRELERELAVRNGEIKEAREWLDERYKALSEADDRAEKAEAENVCLQELIQEFYEWSRRDFPAEQEVREIMNRYHDLLNK